MSGFVCALKSDMTPDTNDDVFKGIWDEYERVIVQSLVTAFGLDFLVHDQHGGDVDTIHNVRKIGEDSEMQYKNLSNQKAYENRGNYDKAAYHSDSRYTSKVRNAKKEFDAHGTQIDDVYVTGNKVIPRGNKTIPRGKQAQLDHVVSAEEIHNDRGRVLAGIDGKELANCDENLKFTNAALNNNMRNKTVEQYIAWCEEHPDQVNYNGKPGEPLPESVKEKLRDEYNHAKKAYDIKLAKKYYTSPQFYKDAMQAVGQRGAEMGLRQALGYVFVEIWISAKEELKALPPGGQLKDMLIPVAMGIEKGVKKAKVKYKEILGRFGEGFIAGMLASLGTTLCNIFFTTAKNLVRIIRQIYASVVEAGKILLFNPDNLYMGERIKSATVILATGASVIVGTAVGELIQKTKIALVPTVGPCVVSFCSTLVSGLLSCTLLVFLDRSEFINRIIEGLNTIPIEVGNYKEIADAMERLAAKIGKLDIEKFRSDTGKYKDIATQILMSSDEQELNRILHSAYRELNIKIPWEGDFDTFMANRNNRLVFE